jgi:type IV pilus assembly protein PilV
MLRPILKQGDAMKIEGKPASQRGSTLLEGLIATLLFSMGLLALMGLQASAIKNTADAKYRTEAAFLANQIIGQMWVENPVNLTAYAHHPTTAAGTCSFSGAASTNANVTAWLGDASTLGTVAGNLPGATAAKQQITVSAANLVTVTICWQGPREAVAHNYVAVAQVNN